MESSSAGNQLSELVFLWMCGTHRAVLKKCVMKGCGAAATAKLLLPVSTRMFICNTHRCSKHTPTHTQVLTMHTGAQSTHTHTERCSTHSAGWVWYDYRHGCVLPARLHGNGPFLSGLWHMYVPTYMCRRTHLQTLF